MSCPFGQYKKVFVLVGYHASHPVPFGAVGIKLYQKIALPDIVGITVENHSEIADSRRGRHCRSKRTVFFCSRPFSDCHITAFDEAVTENVPLASVVSDTPALQSLTTAPAIASPPAFLTVPVTVMA
jgi:hypothetical protein